MSSQMIKLGLLSLISTAAAIPYGVRIPSGYSHPTGTGAPWGPVNGTGPYGPTGTGRHHHHHHHHGSSYTGTSTVTETVYSTETDVSTIYMTGGVSSVNAAEVSTGFCIQETYYVTATNKVTVTVTPGTSFFTADGSSSAQASSAAGYGASSVEAAGVSSVTATATVYNEDYSPYRSSSTAPVSSVAAYSSAVPVSSEAPVSSAAAYSSAAPVSSAAPASSAAGYSSSAVISSSAATTSTSTPVSGNGKRGLAYNDASLTTCFEGHSKVTWAYNWGQTSDGLSSSFEYVPMLWGTSSDFTSSWEGNWKKAVAAGTTNFLCFNEPDLSTQSNLSPSAAAEGYKTYMQPIKAANSNVRLGSPAVTNGANGMGIDWLVNFQSACSSCDIDFVAIHWYESATNIQYFKDHVTEAHTKTGKNVWVTEFGATGSSDQIASFLEEVLPWMDSQDFVERYSYFMASDGLLVSGTEPSSYGLTYATT